MLRRNVHESTQPQNYVVRRSPFSMSYLIVSLGSATRPGHKRVRECAASFSQNQYTGALEEGWAENLYWSLNLVPGETGMNLEESQRGRGSLKLYVNRGTEDWESNS